MTDVGKGRVRIQPASMEDFATLFAMHRALHISHRDSHISEVIRRASGYQNFDAVLQEDLRHLLRDRASLVFIARVDRHPVGYVSGKVRSEPGRLLHRRGFMEDWWVEPEHRGAGIGRMLFEQLRVEFERAGCQVFESSTWASNEGARRAHEKLGFVEAQVSYRLILDQESND